MSNPGYIQALRGAGGVEQSIAASSSMILNQLDRELIRERVGETPQSASFVVQMRDFLNKLTRVDSPREARDSAKAKPEEQRELLERRVRIERRLLKYSPSSAHQERATVSLGVREEGAEETDQFKEEIPPDIQTLKRFAVCYIQKLTGIPSEVQEQIAAELKHLREKILEVVAVKIQAQVEAILFSELIDQIKHKLLAMLTQPVQLARLLFSLKDDAILFPFFEQKTAAQLREGFLFADKQRKGAGLQDLLHLSFAVGVGLEPWIKQWQMETITLSAQGDLFFHLAQLEREEELVLLIDEYRSLWVEHHLQETPWGRFFHSPRLAVIKQELGARGVKKENLDTIENQAKRIAWLKSIALLKDLYLKRVLSPTQQAFETYSTQIQRKTHVVQRLGKRISKEGLKFVEAHLELLAYEAAQYKLQLLRSMQRLSFDEKRGRDISWLDALAGRLKPRAARELGMALTHPISLVESA